jgi:hypothetical protein
MCREPLADDMIVGMNRFYGLMTAWFTVLYRALAARHESFDSSFEVMLRKTPARIHI